MIKKKTNSLIKVVFILITTITFSFKGNSQAQTNTVKNILQKEKWVINSILGLDTNVTIYKLTKSNRNPQFGNIAKFSDDLHFVSYYSAKCGNDYFTDVN